MSAAEKAIVEDWSAGKKAAEFLCKDLALATLRKHFAGADRVFMETTNADREPTLVNSSLVEGAGTVRYEDGWADFGYECDLDPERGTATGFRFTPRGAEPSP